MRLEGSKGFGLEEFAKGPLDGDESREEDDGFLGLIRKRIAIAEANAPKMVAVDNITSSREFIISTRR